jgi:hypothetical protein
MNESIVKKERKKERTRMNPPPQGELSAITHSTLTT